MTIALEKHVAYDAQLPPALCERETYDAVTALAEAQDVSKATIIRTAVKFYLQEMSKNIRPANAISEPVEAQP